MEEERRFHDLFRRVVPEWEDENVRGEVLHGIRSSFHYAEGGHFSDVDYAQWENVHGYAELYGTLGAGLTRRRVLEAAGQCQELEPRLNRDRSLRVVSVGCGPGNDALGFCSAMQDLLGDSIRQIEFTLVDNVRQWYPTVQRVYRLLTEDSGGIQRFGNASRLFARTQVTWDCRGLEDGPDLTRADVVILAKLLSIMDPNEAQELLDKLGREMPGDALLLVIDSPLESHEGRLSMRIYGRTLRFRAFDVLWNQDPVPPYTIQFLWSTGCGCNSRAGMAVLMRSSNYSESGTDYSSEEEKLIQ